MRRCFPTYFPTIGTRPALSTALDAGRRKDEVGEFVSYFRSALRSQRRKVAVFTLATGAHFARDLMVQLAGHDMLKAKASPLIAASALLQRF